MKRKMFLTALCLTLAVFGFAQGRNGGAQRPTMRGNMDAVVDTAIINHMGLPEATVQQVLTLQQAKQEEMKQQMQQQQNNKGQRLSDAERNALQQKRTEFTQKYRQELRAILGDQNYITYLEKQLDRRNQFGARQTQQQQQRQVQAQQQRQMMQRQMQQRMGEQGGEDF